MVFQYAVVNWAWSSTHHHARSLEKLGSLRSKADAIQSKLAKSISVKRDENPAYYDSFSKRIKFKNIVFLILFLKESLYPIE